MLPYISVNWLAIIASAIISFIIGALWYSPGLFGVPWMKSLGMSERDIRNMKKPSGSAMASTYFKMFVATFIMAFVLSVIIHVFGVTSLVDGSEVAILVWFGFIATEKVSSVLFEGRPIDYYIISVMYYFVILLVMSWILVAWY